MSSLSWVPKEVETVPLDSLKLSDYNARHHPPGQIAQLMASIEQYGMTIPLVVDCPSSKQMGLLSVFHKGGSGAPWLSIIGEWALNCSR